MHSYIVKTQEGTTKITAPSPAKAAKTITGGSVIRCKHSDSRILQEGGEIK